MGLYDNFHAINSTRVPTFVPDHSKEIGDYITSANQKHEATTGFMDATEEMLNSAPISEQDQGTYKELLADARTHLSTLSGRPDLENAMGQAYKLAKQVKDRLQPLIARSAAESAWQKSLDDMVMKGDKDGSGRGIDDTTRRRAIAFSKSISTPIRFDENGRVLPGTGFQPVTIAPNVDKNKKIKEFLDMIPEQEWKKVVGSDDGTNSSTDRIAFKDKLPVTIQQQLSAYIKNDPEWSAMNNRDAMFDAHEATQGISDAAVQELLAQPPSTAADAAWHQQMKDAMADGSSPLLALKNVTRQRALTNLYNNDLQVALGGSQHNVDMETTQKYDNWKEKEDYAQANRVKIAKMSNTLEDTWHVPGAVLEVPEWKGTGKDLSDKLDKFTVTSAGYDDQIAKLKHTAYDDPKATDESRIDAQAKIIELGKAKNLNEAMKSSIKAGRERLFEKAAQDLKYSSWTEVKDLAASKVAGELASMPEKATIAKALVDGDYQVVSSDSKPSVRVKGQDLHPAENQVIINGKKYSVRESTKILKAIGTQFTDMKAIQEKANGYATDVTGLETTQVPVRKEDRETMASSLQSMKLYDVNNSGTINTDDMDIDWSKSHVGNSMPELGLISAVIKADGKDKTVFFDPGGSYWRHRGEQLLKSDDPEMRQTGKDMVLNNYSKYRQAFNQASGIVYDHPGLPKGTPITYKDHSFGVHRNKDGTFSVVDAKTKQLLSLKLTPEDTEGKTSHSFGEITSFLNNLIPTK